MRKPKQHNKPITEAPPVLSCVLRDPAQVLTEDLAHVRLRQRVEKADLLRHFVG